MNITNTLANQILENLGYAKEVIVEKKSAEAETETDVVEETVVHSCPLCESTLETEITEAKIESFVNSLVIEEAVDETEVLDNEDEPVKSK